MKENQKQFGFPLDSSTTDNQPFHGCPSSIPAPQAGLMVPDQEAARRSWHCVTQAEKFQLQNLGC